VNNSETLTANKKRANSSVKKVRVRAY